MVRPVWLKHQHLGKRLIFEEEIIHLETLAQNMMLLQRYCDKPSGLKQNSFLEGRHLFIGVTKIQGVFVLEELPTSYLKNIVKSL